MDVIKTYIPKRFRNKKLVNTGGRSGSTTVINSGSDISPSSFVDSDTFYSMFELVDLSGTPAIKAKHEFFSVAGVTAYGTGTVATGGSGSSVSVLDVLNSTDTGSALSANMGRVLNEGKLNRSEISAWALGTEKPAYGISEVTGLSTALSGKSAVGHGHTISDISDFAHVHQWSAIENKPTVITGTTASFTTALETKLNGIAVGANNYTHPATHAPSIIAQDANNRFVTDAYIATWDAKEPAITKGTTAQYFRGDMSLALFPTALPASDVYSWAKAATKPSYIASEIGGLGANYRWLTDAYIATWNAKANGTHTHSFSEIGITGLTANYLTKFNGSTLVNSSIYDSNGNVGIGTTSPQSALDIQRNYGTDVEIKLSQPGSSIWSIKNTASTGLFSIGSGGALHLNIVNANGNVGIGTADPTATLDVNGIGKFKNDIITNFKTWTKDSSKSLKSFLDKFDIDANGNLVVLGNLYSTGEVTAYSSGTGVSGLKLMGNMDANGKNINNVLNINAQQVNTSKVSINVLKIGNNPTGDFPNCVGLFGYRDDEVATYSNLIATYKENTGEYIYANNLFVVDSAGQAAATSFKFGNYSFKQSANGLSICFNGVEQAYITSTGQYVNS